MITCPKGHEISQLQRTITMSESVMLDAEDGIDDATYRSGDDVIDSTDWEAYCYPCEATYAVVLDGNDCVKEIAQKGKDAS